ncbi:hypothetical protein B0A55_11840 [Friedmanniomyces simplex]|uniref:Dipeptidyl-peptidase V n=1 Tax=Friedmanniomyces simplex TaxID=329884 RepID=A0A4U0WHL4_9PEZI|nr:hypothetical protein B0A55_11840 [Friedmanniomyces simplex]
MTLIEDLLDLHIPQSVKLSPSGQQVLWSTSFLFGHKKGEHKQSTLWLAETGKQHSARQLTTGERNEHDPQWSPDGQSIAFISDRGKQGESSAIYLMPASAPGEAFPLTPAEHERDIAKFEFSPDGKAIVFISADEKTEEKKKREKEKDDVQVWGQDWVFNHLRLLNVASKEVTVLESRDVHVTDFAFSDDGSKIAFTETKTSHIESAYQFGTTFCVLDLRTKELVKLSHFPQGIRGPLTWAGNHLYFLGPKAETIKSSSQMVFKLQTDSPEEKVQYETHAYGETNCAMHLLKAGGDVLVLVQDGMHDQIRILAGHTLFSKKQKIETWHAAFTRDSDEIVLAVAQSDTDHPCEIFTTTASGGALVQLSSHGKPLADRTFGSCRFLSCPSSDGEVTLECPFLTPSAAPTDPAGNPTTPLPTVVLIHGGPYSRHTEAFDGLYFMWTPLLLASGYAVLMVDYRGSSGRGDAWARYAYQGCGTHDYVDVIAQTHCAIANGWADKERLVVGGYSQGGFLSYLASVRNGTHGLGWRFAASIPGAGVSDSDSMCFTSDLGFWQAENCGGTPWSQRKGDTRNRVGSAVWEFGDAVKAGVEIPPMLMLHGEKDERVPIEQAAAMRRAMESAGLVFEYVTYPREGHLMEERRHIADMGERVKGWVERYIGPGVQ